MEEDGGEGQGEEEATFTRLGMTVLMGAGGAVVIALDEGAGGADGGEEGEEDEEGELEDDWACATTESRG
jgi:hypothetical protein